MAGAGILSAEIGFGVPQRVGEPLGAQGLDHVGHRVGEAIVSYWTIPLER